MATIDLCHLRVVTELDLVAAVRQGLREVRVCEKALLTPSAVDCIRDAAISLVRVPPGAVAPGSYPTVSAASDTPPPEVAALSPADVLYSSAEAMALKEEIIRVGRKLWERQFVDGNGGNISGRLNDRYILCTPTQCSKADLTPDDFALVDMDGNQVAGTKPRSTEIFLHLEIYRHVPQAHAVLHCHPPHATAYAITGTVPPTCLIPEHELLVGSVALAPYETPGTPEFARTVLPFVRDHNMILLQNHGVVCWADSVTHAEWCAEVVDNYCRTIILAAHLGAPLVHIPGDKTADLLATKKKSGMPDPRYGLPECQLCDLPEFPDGITVRPKDGGEAAEGLVLKPEDFEALVQAITDQVMTALKRE
jgi:L-fuculose-phosphate aldolase